MNTFSKITLALFSVFSMGALAGCNENGSFEAMATESEAVEEEAVAEAEEALVTAETAPVLSSTTLYRVQIMEATTQKCVDFAATSQVSLGQPVVRKTCNGQPIGNNNNTQAFYFEQVYVGGNPVPNRYMMKPANTEGGQDLCVYNSGQTSANGGNLIASNCTPGNDSRLVDIKAYEDDTKLPSDPWRHFLTINMVHSGKCLTVVGSYPGDNVTITQYGTANDADRACAHWPNQRIRIVTN